MSEKLSQVPLAELADVNPSVAVSGLPDSLVSFIPMQDVSDAGQWQNHEVRQLRDVRSGYTRFVEGDVLFAKITPCMENGKGAHATGLIGGVGFGSTEFHVLRAKAGSDPRFVFHWTQAAELRRSAEARMSGSAGQRRVPASFFSYFQVPRLPLPEQRRIAEVLDTADEAIRQTEAIIAKLKQMKQGLLHDLLTRGLDENGELRDPVAHPEQFKDSPLGRIPRGWAVQPIGNLLAGVVPAMRSGPFGSELLASELMSEGVPLLGIDNVYPERFVAEYTRFVSRSKYLLLRRYAVRPHDVMVTIMGTVGRSCLVPEGIGEALSSKHVWTLTFDQTRYSPSLASLQINYAPWVLAHFRRDEQGGIMSAIRSDTLRQTLLPVPPLQEQSRILDAISADDLRIRTEEAYRDKLRLLKQGFMQDLLTGRVRVPVAVDDARIPAGVTG